VLYEIDDTKHVVVALDIRHHSAAYRLDLPPAVDVSRS
jgi:mRNA-degrading endonuclease RelE of RelBE toxin-antitoxin system